MRFNVIKIKMVCEFGNFHIFYLIIYVKSSGKNLENTEKFPLRFPRHFDVHKFVNKHLFIQ